MLQCSYNNNITAINPAIIIFSSYLAIQATNQTLNGCDFIQLHFKSRTPSNYHNGYQQQSTAEETSYILGLGLRYHQSLTETKTYILGQYPNHDNEQDDHNIENTPGDGSGTCQPYNDLESKLLYLEANELDLAEFFYAITYWFNKIVIGVIGLNTLLSYFTPPFPIYNFIFLSCTVFILIFAIIPACGYHILSSGRSTICDSDRHSSSRDSSHLGGLYHDDANGIPLSFTGCQLGHTEFYARDSILFQCAGCIGVVFVLAFMAGWDSLFDERGGGEDNYYWFGNHDDKSCFRWRSLFNTRAQTDSMNSDNDQDDDETKVSFEDDSSRSDDDDDDEIDL